MFRWWYIYIYVPLSKIHHKCNETSSLFALWVIMLRLIGVHEHEAEMMSCIPETDVFITAKCTTGLFGGRKCYSGYQVSMAI